MNGILLQQPIAWMVKDRIGVTYLTSEANIADAWRKLGTVTELVDRQVAFAEANHWRNNHDNQVQQNAVLRQRPDLPIDRIPASGTMNQMQVKIADLQRELNRVATAHQQDVRALISVASLHRAEMRMVLDAGFDSTSQLVDEYKRLAKSLGKIDG
jgi:uncharacterized lipoprotein YmbA